MHPTKIALLNYIINQGGGKRIEIQNIIIYTYSSDISHHLEKFHSINTLNLIHKDHNNYDRGDCDYSYGYTFLHTSVMK